MGQMGWTARSLAIVGIILILAGSVPSNLWLLSALGVSGIANDGNAGQTAKTETALLLSPLSRSLQHLRVDIRDARLSWLSGGWAVARGQVEDNRRLVDAILPQIANDDARRLLQVLQQDLEALEIALKATPVDLVRVDQLQLRLDQQASWLGKALDDALALAAASRSDNSGPLIGQDPMTIWRQAAPGMVILGIILLLVALSRLVARAVDERQFGVTATRRAEDALETARDNHHRALQELQNVVKTREGVVAELEGRLTLLREERDKLGNDLRDATGLADSVLSERAMYRGLADIAPGAAFYSADGETINLCNPACEALFDGLAPQNLTEILDESGRDKLAGMMLDGQGSLVVRDGIVPEDSSGQSLVLVARPLQANGEGQYVHGFVAALLPADNPAELIARLQQDMEAIQLDEERLRDERDQALHNLETLNKEVEETLEAREAALIEAQREARVKADLLAMVSHETRTPLTGLKGVIELLLGTRLDERQARYARSAAQSIDAALSLLNDMLDLSKMDADRLVLVSEPFDLSRLLQEVLTILESRAVQKGLAIEITGAEEPVWVKGDEGRIRQILLNLVGNAVKFTEHGYVRLALDQHEQDGEVRQEIRVIDTGPGIAEAELEALFEAFTQTASGRHSNEAGTGLGLAISQGLAKRMDGEIQVRSRRGEGSVFALYTHLPVASPEEQTAARDRSKDLQAPALSGVRFKRPLKILLAEDNDIVRMVVSEQLESMGHQVLAAETGRLVVVTARDENPDVVLMDVNLPDMDGIAATRAIRDLSGRAARVPIIALTANALAGDAERCLAAGMDDFLVKPVPVGLLANKLAAWGDPVEAGPVTDGQAEAPKVVNVPASRIEPAVHLEIDMPDTDQAIDHDALDMLLGSLGQIRGLTLITDFIREIDTRSRNIAAAVAAGDYKTCEAEAHLLKGSAGSMKAGRVFACADAIVEACREDQNDKVPGTIPLLEQMTGELTAELKSRLVKRA